MVTIMAGNNFNKAKYRVSGNTIIMPDGNQRAFDHAVTLADVLAAADVDTTRGMVNLDGGTVSAADMNKPFEAIGITDGNHILSTVAKADNAR